MKTIITFSAILLIINNLISAQPNDTIYYDKNFIETNSNDFVYFRLYAKFGDLVKVTDYYKNGKVQMTGGYKSIDFKEPSGPFFYYNKRGRIEDLEVYEPYNYPDILSYFINSDIIIPDQSDSLNIYGYYYRSGKIHGIGFGKDPCTQHGTWLYFDKQGKIYCRQDFLNGTWNGRYILYDYDGNAFLKGFYKDGKRDGSWEYYSFDGEHIKKTRFYSNGEVVKTIR